MSSPLVSFWHGQLGWMERASIATMLRHGHRLAIYSYAALELPAGVEARDARSIVPEGSEDYAVMHERVADFSDLFRYVLMEAEAGIWVDLDLWFLRPLVATNDHVFGWEKADRINGAVLRIPHDSPLLGDLLSFCRTRPWYAPWWRTKHKLRQRLAIAMGRPLPLKVFPKAQLGPKALTYFAKQRGLDARALPQHVFYPVGPQEFALLLGPAEAVEARITPDTIAVHFWSSEVKRVLAGQMPARDSYLGRLLDTAHTRQ